MSDLSDLYQEVILDHNRRPRNFRVLDAATHKAEGHNPLCGDRLELFLTVDDGVITDVGFLGSGCAISKASASIMTDCLKGCPVIDACTLFERFHRMVTTPPDLAVEDLGKLSAFAGVREFPARVKCASLAWHTFKAALNQAPKATTESTD
jgi:nitrogen fixation NifU-like protein